MLRINISATCCYALLLPQDVAAAAFRFDFILFFPSLILAVVVIIAIVDAVLGGALQKSGTVIMSISKQNVQHMHE